MLYKFALPGDNYYYSLEDNSSFELLASLGEIPKKYKHVPIVFSIKGTPSIVRILDDGSFQCVSVDKVKDPFDWEAYLSEDVIHQPQMVMGVHQPSCRIYWGSGHLYLMCSLLDSYPTVAQGLHYLSLQGVYALKNDNNRSLLNAILQQLKTVGLFTDRSAVKSD